MVINSILNNDLHMFYKGIKHEIFMKTSFPIYRNPYEFIGSKFYVNVLRFHVFDWLIQWSYDYFLINNSKDQKGAFISDYNNLYREGRTYFGKGFEKFKDELLKDKSALRKIERLSECYDMAEKLAFNYKHFNIDDIEIHTNLRYKSFLIKTFRRFNMNQKCIVSVNDIKKMQMIIIVEGKEINETEFIQCGSNS